MMHVRQQLRDAAKSALASAVTAVDGRVGGERAYSRSSAQTPAIEVSTPQGSARRLTGDGVFFHTITLEITIIGNGHSGMEDALDAIAEGVEATILGTVQTEPFNASVTDISTAFDAGEGAAAQPARMSIAFSVQVVSDEDDMQTVS